MNVLTTASRHGDALLATDVFRVLGNRGTVFEKEHYELLFDAYINASDLRTAMKTLCFMQESGFRPDNNTTRTLFKHLRKSDESVDEAIAALRFLREEEHREIPIAGPSAIIEALVRRHSLSKALEYYKTIHELCPPQKVPGSRSLQTRLTVATFNSLLKGCSNDGRKDIAMFLVAEMKALNVTPNSLTWDRLVLVCTSCEDVNDAWKYYEEMKDMGFTAREGTVAALFRALVIAGDIRAWALIAQWEAKGIYVRSHQSWLAANWKGAASARRRLSRQPYDAGEDAFGSLAAAEGK